jgi:hypothetical protein
LIVLGKKRKGGMKLIFNSCYLSVKCSRGSEIIRKEV